MSILAIDLGGTQFKSALISGDYQVEEVFDPKPAACDLVTCQNLLVSMIEPNLDRVSGIAVSCPETVDTESGIIYNGGMLRFLHEFPMKDFLVERFAKPVAVLNDGKAAFLAEVASGNLKGISHGLVMVLGTGLGGGIIINGQLYQGAHFQAGELSFALPQDKKERLTGEDLAGLQLSAVHLIATCAKSLNLDDEKDGISVFEAIKAKDERFYPFFQAYCRAIAIQINNIQSVLDEQRVVIGGGISSQDILIEKVNRQLNQLEKEDAWAFMVIKRPEIRASHYKNAANLVGVAYCLNA
ncbi:Beta-glucoside kinase [Streptococcus pluranimalium]|uniref:ROK family protein n=1 Tax=Streptococcus pluranimalium TaxID=82348 RepID=UPI0039E85E71